MCLELALEGERLCKSGDCRAGVAFFQVNFFKDIQDEKVFVILLLLFLGGYPERHG